MRFKHLLYILFFYLGLSCKENPQEYPIKITSIPLNQSQQHVVDLSHLFSEAETDSLIKKILHYEERTTNQIAVLTIDSLPKHTSIQKYGTEVANNWGVGTKEKNNGLLITISKYDRNLAISTGIGTAQTISDTECKAVIDRIMIPQFKNKNYYKGVDKALDSLIFLWD
ncbi:TPM domain-containing protein [Winogradskyella sediminis]|uniref:TPM domain-containing protein n=1 Tax=Winogradskyella sediminis TaxID=1382466 RepID=A0A1H1UWZ8_9FLAO|nr:TPM domain-containing protein [Winogradskyella sediminis]SDS76339.1 uncharacterized protein SAMN04489797_2362 [Winogradskyella sediminis]